MNRTEVKRRQALAISGIIMILTGILVSRLAGFRGITYISVAVFLYGMVDILMNVGSVNAVTRLIRLRYTKGQYRNAEKMKKDVFLFQLLCSLFLSGVIFLAARPICTYVFRLPLSNLILAVLIPSAFIRTVTVTKIGISRGEGLESLSVLTDVFRSIFILIFSLLFCNVFIRYGTKVSGLLGEENFVAMYGGIGFSVAVLVSELLVLLFVFFLAAAGNRKRKNAADGMRTTHSMGDNLKAYYSIRGILLFICLMVFVTFPLGLLFLCKAYPESEQILDSYGVFLSAYCGLGGIFILLVVIVMLPILGSCLGFLRKDELRYARNVFQNGVHIGSVYAMFFSTFLMVESHRLGSVFFPEQSELADKMLKTGSVIVLLIVLNVYFAEFLILTGKKAIVLGTVLLADIVQIVALAILLNKSGAEILSLVYAALLANLLTAALLGFFTHRRLRIGMMWMQFLLIPLFVACIAGLLQFFIDRFFTPHLGENLALFLCFLISGILYLIGLLVLRNFRMQDLEGVPGGKFISALGQMLHVL